MAKGDLYINGKDAYISWGISLDATGLSALMTPAPNKELVQNKSRLQSGKSVIATTARVDERNVNLMLNLTANNEEEFFTRYASFCQELATGVLEIRTRYQAEVVYRMNYVSCQQFSQLMRGIAKYSLRLNEPDPTNRSIE